MYLLIHSDPGYSKNWDLAHPISMHLIKESSCSELRDTARQAQTAFGQVMTSTILLFQASFRSLISQDNYSFLLTTLQILFQHLWE